MKVKTRYSDGFIRREREIDLRQETVRSLFDWIDDFYYCDITINGEHFNGNDAVDRTIFELCDERGRSSEKFFICLLRPSGYFGDITPQEYEARYGILRGYKK